VSHDGPVISKAERLTKLVATLLDVSQPLSLRQIVEQVDGYPPAFESARVKFMNDRAELRDEGIEIDTIGNGEDARYRIDPKKYYLPDLGLTEDEALALNLAASRVRLEGHDPDEALLKLDGFGVDGPALVALPSDPRLPVIWSAVRARAVLSFHYHDVDRDVAPYGLLCREGNWYIAGDDRTRPGRKIYRVDRIVGDVTVGQAGAFERPADFDLETAMADEAYEYSGDEPVDVEVRLDRVMAGRPLGEVVSTGDDGSVVVRLRVSNRPAFRSWVLGLRGHARVLSPPAVVDDVTSWLRRIVAAG
jgi:predicted DNA-binding transcriptional regulator YafY